MIVVLVVVIKLHPFIPFYLIKFKARNFYAFIPVLLTLTVCESHSSIRNVEVKLIFVEFKHIICLQIHVHTRSIVSDFDGFLIEEFPVSAKKKTIFFSDTVQVRSCILCLLLNSIKP